VPLSYITTLYACMCCRFQALQPLPDSTSGVVCLTGAQPGSQQQHDAATREASRLVDLALAAVRGSGDG
jgi:hypothetical protein